MVEPIGWGAVGIALWEIIKKGGAAIAKRKSEKRDGQRKNLHTEIRASIEVAQHAIDHARDYYSAEAAEKDKLARFVLHDIKVLASHLQNVNNGLAVLGYTNTTGSKLIAFRQALTLDMNGAGQIHNLDHDGMMKMYNAFHGLHGTLCGLIYETS